MKKGLYLKENRATQEHETFKQLSADERKALKVKHLRKQKHHQRTLVGICAMAVLFSAVAVIILFVFSGRSLEGKWNMDDVTSYEFYGNGKGCMVLPTAEYEFTYTVDSNTLYIDFAYDGAKDSQYIFTIDGNTLILDGGNATTQGTYALTKSE